MGTSGSEGGQQKPTSRKTGRALLSDPYTYVPTWSGMAFTAAARVFAALRAAPPTPRLVWIVRPVSRAGPRREVSPWPTQHN
jgi:hypothetical protein